MHSAAVIPNEEITDPPLMMPRVLLLARVRPQFVEYFFAFLDGQIKDIGVKAASEVQAFPLRGLVGTHERVSDAWRFRGIRHFCELGPPHAGRVVHFRVIGVSPVHLRRQRVH